MEYSYTSYVSRSVARWPRSRKGIDGDIYENTHSSLLESIRKAKENLAFERAGGRRRALEQSIEKAKALLKELDTVKK